MDTFLKVCAGSMICVILHLVLSKRDKDIAAVLSLIVCCMIIGTAAVFLEDILSFFYKMQDLAQMDSQLLEILMKTTAVGILAQVSELVCSDSGNQALGKTIQLLATLVILWLSLPLMNSFLELIGKVLGAA